MNQIETEILYLYNISRMSIDEIAEYYKKKGKPEISSHYIYSTVFSKGHMEY